MKAGKILAGALVAIGIVAFLSVIIVKEVNQAIILQFGDPKRIIMKPGLNFKIPFIQNVVYLDKRILILTSTMLIPKFCASLFTPSLINAICFDLSLDNNVCNSS